MALGVYDPSTNSGMSGINTIQSSGGPSQDTITSTSLDGGPATYQGSGGPGGAYGNADQSTLNNVWNYASDPTNPYAQAQQKGAAYGQFLQGAAGISNSLYQQQAAQNAAMGNYDQSYYDNNAGYIRGSNQNDQALLAADQYRNVTLGNFNNAEDRRNVGDIWQNLQDNITNQRGTSAQDLAIRTWMNQRNQVYNTQNYQNQLGQNTLQQQDTSHALNSQATGAGAMLSNGLAYNQGSALQRMNLANQGALTGYNQTTDQLHGTQETDQNNYQAAMNALQNQYNIGQNNYTHGMTMANSQQAALQSLANTYGIRQNQLGLDLQRSLANNTHSDFMAQNQLAQQTASQRQAAISQMLAYMQQGLSI